MEIVLAFVIGGLYAAGIYLMLRRSMPKLVMGLIFLSNATNLLIFVAAGLTRGKPALVAPGETSLGQPHADPLPQALVLTAIVIGFGVLAFFLTLLRQAYRKLGVEDLDALRGNES